MADGLPQVARVMMPERGVFFVCLPEGFDPACGTRCVIRLDYGEDVAEITSFSPYDPDRHGPRIPGFELLRPVMPEDERRLRDNASLADAMAFTFRKLAAASGVTLELAHTRLALGRGRLFIRYLCDVMRPNLAHPIAEVRRLFNVSVNAWQLGPREKAAFLGALAPCGRACCCASWQQSLPENLTLEHVRAMGVPPGAQNGVCGRIKCCLVFEEGT